MQQQGQVAIRPTVPSSAPAAPNAGRPPQEPCPFPPRDGLPTVISAAFWGPCPPSPRSWVTASTMTRQCPGPGSPSPWLAGGQAGSGRLGGGYRVRATMQVEVDALVS